MGYNQLVKDLQNLFFCQKTPLMSLLNITTLILVGWAIIPESIYYNMLIWVIFATIWIFLAIIYSKKDLVKMVVHKRMWVIAIWPLYSMFLWISGYGFIHRTFVAIGFMIAISFFYIFTDQKKDLAAISRIGIWMYSLIAITTLMQIVTRPNIARELAVGRIIRNFRASSLLANFFTIYEVVLITVTLAGLIIAREVSLKQKEWRIVFILNFLLVLFAGYDIALVSSLLGIGLLLLLKLTGKRKTNNTECRGRTHIYSSIKDKTNPLEKPFKILDKVELRNTKSHDSKKQNEAREFEDIQINENRVFSSLELIVTSVLYTTPAIMVLIFQKSINQFIIKMDYHMVAISEKLFQRIWVYLRSLHLFIEFPVFGFGVQPNPASFLSGQHSAYLDILAEFGLIGFLVFLIPWVYLLLTMRSLLPKSRQKIYWVTVIIFQFIFMLNPVLEISTATMLFLLIPGILIETDNN